MTTETNPPADAGTSAAPAPAAEPPKPAPEAAAKPTTRKRERNMGLFEPAKKADPSPAAEAKPEPVAEAKPDEPKPEGATEAKPEPAAPVVEPEKKTEPKRPRERIGGELAKGALERQKLAAEKAKAEADAKEAADAKTALEKRLAEYERKEKMVQSDPRALLDLYNVKFDDLAKHVANGPPMDPRTIELKLQMEELNKRIVDQGEEIKKRDAKLEQEARAGQYRVMAEAEKGKIAAALGGDKYKHAAVAYTPDELWRECEIYAQQVGRFPSMDEVLSAAEGLAVKMREGFSKLEAPKTDAKPAPKPAPAPVAKPAPAAAMTITNGSGGPAPKRERQMSRTERLAELSKKYQVFNKREG